jgi:16S rRNA (adenine1518-N6/adenine1519-N6)-dimethyltransferase
MTLETLPSLRDVIRIHDLAADKRFGQHFLTDPNILARIAAAPGNLAGRTVIEIGPGPGGLTRALLDAGAERLIAVEIDPRCVAVISELSNAVPGKIELVEADALTLDVQELGTAPRQIVANLPYNVATPLLIGWLKAIAEDATALEGMTLMFQREVADRLVAKPGTKIYGRLSVMTQWLTRPLKLFDLPGGAFTPPPKVVSSVVRLAPSDAAPGLEAFTAMERVVAAAFGQRRKMLRQSLKALGGPPESILDPAGIDGARRAETLDVVEFVRLAEAWRRGG